MVREAGKTRRKKGDSFDDFLGVKIFTGTGKERETSRERKHGRDRGDRNRERRKEKGVSPWIPEMRKQKLSPSARKSSLALRTSRDLQV
jgi:hypothetical protein